MKTVGIVAEYNPFHSGHEYQISYAKKTLGADYCIVVMSGPFTQRGLPAIFDKYTRAESAIKCGADLVLELPAVYATASAEIFAEGAVKILQATGIVDTVLFGCETPDMSKIEKAADILLAEPVSYVDVLKESLANGESFPKARALALASQGITGIAEDPNNILAIEYVKAIKKYNYTLTPVGMQRLGAGYHDLDLNGVHASASGIREHIFSSSNTDFLSQIPDTLKDNYMKVFQNNCYLSPEDFSLPLLYALLTHSSFDEYSDCSKELSNKILRCVDLYESFDSFCGILKSKDIAHTRITRVLNHIMLQITKEFSEESRTLETAPYLRILSAKKTSEELFTAIKKGGYAPMVTSPKVALEQLHGIELEIFKKDLFSADLYRSILSQKTHQKLPNEFTRKFSLIS